MSILETALESRIDDTQKEQEEKLIVMKGPLSELLYRALNILYAKSGENKDLDYALESQAQDVVVSRSVIESVNDGVDDSDVDYVVFGVTKNSVIPETLVEMKNILSEKETDTKVALLVVDDPDSKELNDTAVMSNYNGSVSSMTAALESLITNQGTTGNKYISCPSIESGMNQFIDWVTSKT